MAVPKPAAAQPTSTSFSVPFDRTAAIAIGVAAAALILGFAFRRRKRAEPDEAVPTPAPQAPEHDNDARPTHTAEAVAPAAAGAAAAAVAADAVSREPEPLTRRAQAEPEPIEPPITVPSPHETEPAAPLTLKDEPLPVAVEPAEPPKATEPPVLTEQLASPAAAPFMPSAPTAPAEPTAPAAPAEPEARAELPAPTVPENDLPDAAVPPSGQPESGTPPAQHEDAAGTTPVIPTSPTELNDLTYPASAEVPAHEFPADAVSALDSLDMPLPPRVGEPEPGLPISPDFASQEATNGLPAETPRTLPADASTSAPDSAGQSASSHGEPPAPITGSDEWDDDEPLDPPASGSVPESRPAAAFGSLGGAQFGALNLDFDLDLPVGPSATLPPPTDEALDRIAQNKLELAAEYVELGDLHGARMLLNEVIDAGRAGTRDAARTLLAKLADAT
ncbi:FimV/HubP family polar landmark protein [Burkholderia plantarii]|uniref:FimV/HubP family polar landmark protein n=1 Tax=Burkholderia plantarii TaxID=41899 RepID=UPI001F5BD4DD|nr:FimV/HubP family polar landmark protein [Burkholderia plantarii]